MSIFVEGLTSFLADNMDYVSSKEYARAHGLSDRTVRNYCALGKLQGARLTGKTWSIPACASLPARKNARVAVSPLLAALREQKGSRRKGGIYHRTQVDLTYNSNHIEGSRLTHEQTRYIFETNTIGVTGAAVKVDDVIETSNHFRCFDFIIDNAHVPLSQGMIKELHRILKSGTSDEGKSWFAVGDYKRLPNEVGGQVTTAPAGVAVTVGALLKEYGALKTVTFEDVLDFHQRFEAIHPFQDGNGRVGRLIMFKECLAHGLVPFIVTDELKMFYYRGLREWPHTRGYLTDTCLTAQDHYKALLTYFKIDFK